MASTDGCGAEDIRRSIQSLCHQCDQQAGDDKAAKAALKTKCDAILASAPAAQLQKLYSADAPTGHMRPPQNAAAMFTLILGMAVVGIAGASISTLVRSRSGALQEADGSQCNFVEVE